MILWRRIPAWVLRAWPVLTVIPVIMLHSLALLAFDDSQSLVNKLAGFLLQAVGGILILYSVNDNLGMFRKQSLIATALCWIQDFPISRRTSVSASAGLAWGNAGAKAEVDAKLVATTVEERLSILEKDLSDLRASLEKEISVLQSKISVTKSELDMRINVTSVQLGDLAQKLDHSIVGGFKVQAFGVLLALYGALVSLYV